jgi:glutaredoxin
VQIYGAQWCPLSLGFRKYLEQNKIPFEFLDVEKDPRAEAADKAMNDGKLKFPMVVGEVAGYWKPGDKAAVLKNPKLAELQAALGQYGFSEPVARG